MTMDISHMTITHLKSSVKADRFVESLAVIIYAISYQLFHSLTEPNTS